MKNAAKRSKMVWVLAVLLCVCMLVPAGCGRNGEPSNGEETDGQGESLTLEGELQAGETDGVFLLEGYELIGPADYSLLVGRRVQAKGAVVPEEEENQTRRFEVEDIDWLDAGEPIILNGRVVYRDLEGGFYEVEGYRLSGDQDFSAYEGQLVEVHGVESLGPSIFMTLAIEVEELIVLDADPQKDGEGEEIRTDSGNYVGQIDANSIEVRIVGVPDEHAYRAFRLTEDVKNDLRALSLEEGDWILFDYFVDEHERNVMVRVEAR